MFLKKLKLHNYRNFSHLDIAFDKGANSIIGKNGQGKSNLLEAIYLISTGKSFRNSSLNTLIKNDAPCFNIAAQIEKDSILQTVSFLFSPTEKKIEYNSSCFSSFTPLLGSFPSIIVSSANSQLISGKPLLRRNFLNIFLAQSDPLYVHHLLRFIKALKQRNTLLKKKELATISFWDMELAKSAMYITNKRQNIVLALNQKLQELAITLSLDINVSLEYLPSIEIISPIEKMLEKYLEKLHKNRKKELLFSATLFGPHRDDLSIKINSLPAKNFSSEGQKNLFGFLIAMAELFLFKEKSGETPWICFDDFGQNLDSANQHKIRSFLLDLQTQTFITSPSDQQFSGSTFTLEGGSVQKVVSKSLI